MTRIMALLLTGTVLFAVSCEKFDEGGSVKKADKEIIGTWKMTGYLRDGVDEFSMVSITGYTEIYTADGAFTRKYTEEDGNVHDDTGTFEMASDNKSVSISGVSSINNFSEANSSLSTSSYAIIKLTASELWIEYSNGGNLHQFRMEKQ